MKILEKYLFLTIVSIMFSNCNYLDVVPDNIATIDNAFTSRLNAEQYLFTCYSRLLPDADVATNPAFLGGDEIWTNNLADQYEYEPMLIGRGLQNILNPNLDFWNGDVGRYGPYKGIRECNIFLENIDNVPNMIYEEKARWRAEVKFLKAIYHFTLLKMYGPIVIIDENLPISASPDEVKLKRQPVDDCVNYIVNLLDEAASDLPDVISDELTELGRITKPIALSMKAYIHVVAASPLFNGNPDYINFRDKDGISLFNSNYEVEKWEHAAEACREAIELCHSVGMKLYYFQPSVGMVLSEKTITQMSIRNAVCEKWNSEIIWGNTNSRSTGIQSGATPNGLDPATAGNQTVTGLYSPPLKIAELFYSRNGVPISEDKNYNYSGRFDLRVATEEERYNLQPGYTTVGLNFDRELRYYASLAFDGGLWYGQGRLDDNNQWIIQSKAGQLHSSKTFAGFAISGYWPKKLVHYQSILQQSSYTRELYPWPIMRLADLYLLYAEALNEAEGATSEALYWINLVRERADLNSVEESWSQYSVNPGKYTSKEGLRDIIQQERLIELAFENKRFWDLRRWKRAYNELNKQIEGWDIGQETEELYYRKRIIYNQTFLSRDYLWPISENDLIVNSNLVQNPGW